MAAVAAEELEVKASTESAQTFIDWFYTCVSDRKPLAAFYVNSNPKYAAAGAAADISVNGQVCAQPADFAALLDTQAGYGAAAVKANGAANGATGGAPASTTTTTTTPANAASLRVRYDVDGFDVHVLNPQFRLACPDLLLQRVAPVPNTALSAPQRQQLQRMVSLLVQVTGHVQYGGTKDAPRGAFTEVFVLVPNWDVLAAGAKAPRGAHRYLILSQNFRAL